MTDTTLPSQPWTRLPPHRWLRLSGQAWFCVAAGSQMLFGLYIVALYGGSALLGRLNEATSFMPVGFIEGDGPGNAQLGVHLAAAAFLSLAGAWQLVPQVRQHWPRLHRLTGRLYLPLAIVAGLGGALLIWLRESPSAFWADVSITLNGLLIAAFAVLAWRAAVARRFGDHQAWATRLFLAVSGVWFLRVGMMAWVAINLGKPVGIGNLDGWFYVSWNFGSWIVPLLMYEAWRRAQRAPARLQLALAGGMGIAIALTLVGSVLAALGMWLPRFL
jgi:hypothetical protein